MWSRKKDGGVFLWGSLYPPPHSHTHPRVLIIYIAQDIHIALFVKAALVEQQNKQKTIRVDSIIYQCVNSYKRE